MGPPAVRVRARPRVVSCLFFVPRDRNQQQLRFEAETDRQAGGRRDEKPIDAQLRRRELTETVSFSDPLMLLRSSLSLSCSKHYRRIELLGAPSCFIEVEAER